MMSFNHGADKDSTFHTVLLIRLIAASVLFAVSLVLNLPAFLRIILLAVAAIAAGYDIVLKAADSAVNGKYFATPFIIVFVALVSFLIGFSTEGAALVILYQLGLLLIAYAREYVLRSAVDQLHGQDESVINHMSGLIDSSEATSTVLGAELANSADTVLKGAVVFAILYAILLPLFTGFSYTVSIHRALIIILVSMTGSIAASMPMTAAYSMCLSAGQGIIPSNAKALEVLSDIKTVVFDKAGVFSESDPRVVSVQPSVIDKNTFAAFAAHAVYYSEQNFAGAVSALYNKEYKPDVISEFRDIPGSGVELLIGGAPVILAKRGLFERRGVSLPGTRAETEQNYYMTVAGKYVGNLSISTESNDGSEDLVADCKAAGIESCILLSEDSREVSAAFADEMQFTGLYSQCDTAAKLRHICEIADGSDGKVMYVYSNGIKTHSDADIDVRISSRTKYADILLLPEFTPNLPYSFDVSKRLKEVTTINALIPFIVKTVLIFLAIIGYCSLWFAVVADTAAAIGTVVNSTRVSKESVASVYRYKSGKY